MARSWASERGGIRPAFEKRVRERTKYGSYLFLLVSVCTSNDFKVLWPCLLAVDSRVLSCFEVEYAGFDPFFLSYTRLAFAVKVPDGLGEQFGDVRVVLLEIIPY